MITHSLLVYIPYSIWGNALYLEVPGRHSEDVKTPGNFCGGYLSNMLFQDCWMNGTSCRSARVLSCGSACARHLQSNASLTLPPFQMCVGCNLKTIRTPRAAVYAVAVVFYIVVVKRMTPARYYPLWYPLMALALGAFSFLMYFNFSQLLLSLTMSSVTAMSWFLVRDVLRGADSTPRWPRGHLFVC